MDWFYIMRLLELKILPKQFEKALNSGDETTSKAYKKWREEHFPDWYTMGEIESEWRNGLPRYSEKQWLEIFPQEARLTAKRNLEEFEEKRNKLMNGIKEGFRHIRHKTSDEFGKWFFKEIIKVWHGQELAWLNKRIRALRYALNPIISKGGVTPEEIEQVKLKDTRELALEDLQKARRIGQKVIGLCPKHDDKRPSFVVFKDGGWKCFGCQISGGNAIDYCIKIRGMGFVEAVRFLLNR